jgi:hypothetical protein
MNTNTLLTQHIAMLSRIQEGVIKLFANTEEGYYRLYCNEDARPYHITDISRAICDLQQNITVYIINPDSKPPCGY